MIVYTKTIRVPNETITQSYATLLMQNVTKDIKAKFHIILDRKGFTTPRSIFNTLITQKEKSARQTNSELLTRFTFAVGLN